MTVFQKKTLDLLYILRELKGISKFVATIIPEEAPPFLFNNLVGNIFNLPVTADRQLTIKPGTIICRDKIVSRNFFEIQRQAPGTGFEWLVKFDGDDPDLREHALAKGWEEIEE